MMSLTLHAGCGVATAFSPTYPVFATLRFFMGLSNLGAFLTAYTLGEMTVCISITSCLSAPLPPPFPLSLAGAATSIIFVATKVLSRQTRVRHDVFCRDKTFLATKLFVATNMLSRQTRDTHSTNTFIATKDVFCRDQNYTCRSSRQ